MVDERRGEAYRSGRLISSGRNGRSPRETLYSETLGLEPEGNRDMAFVIGEVILLLKPEEEWYGKPTDELNARVTLRVRDSYAAEKALKERGVVISDPVTVYGDNPIAAFLDSEGNKLWFCSAAKLGEGEICSLRSLKSNPERESMRRLA